MVSRQESMSLLAEAAAGYVEKAEGGFLMPYRELVAVGYGILGNLAVALAEVTGNELADALLDRDSVFDAVTTGIELAYYLGTEAE